MDSLNTILNSGTYGASVGRHNDNYGKIQQALTRLENVALDPLTIKKTYATLTDAGADTNPVGDDGVAIKIGQIVSVTAENKVYKLKTLTSGVPTWEEIGLIGDIAPVTNKINAVEARIDGDLLLPVYDGTNIETQYSELIGAWRSGFLNPSTPTSYIRENINGYLELRIVSSVASDISYVTTNKIDVTGLQAIEVEMENISNGSEATIRTRVTLGTAYNETWSSGTGILYKTGPFARQKFSIDVSSRTGLYYLHIYVSKNTASSAIIPHLKVYSVNFISKIQSPVDIKNSVNGITPEKFLFTMGYDAGATTIRKVIVSESTGMITFPSTYRIVDRQGNYYLGASGKSVSAICTDYVTGNPCESSYGYLMYNKVTNEVRVIYWGDWKKVSDGWLTLALVKRSSPSTSVIGNILLNTAIAWEYENATSAEISKDVIARNIDMQAAVNAAINNKYYTALGTTKKRFNFIHFTDNHGDTKLTGNVIKYLNGTPEIDMAINTGDMLASNFTSSKTVITQMTGSAKPILPVLGNHDVGNSMDVALCGDHTEVYNTLIKPFNDKGWIDAQGKNYWFKDFTADKIRLIALYEYDEPLDLNETDQTKYKIQRGKRVYSQVQINWLIGLLQGTPTDYHLIMLAHQNQQDDNVGTINSDWNTYNTSIGTPQNCIDGDLVPDLIDAWQNGAAISQSYSFKDEASYLTPLSVSADFTTRGAGVFVGYVYGHSHIDIIGTLGKYPSQNFFSCIPSINYAASNAGNDMPKVADTKSEDAFNVITVGTSERKVYVVRIGANYTKDLKERKTLVVSY